MVFQFKNNLDRSVCCPETTSVLTPLSLIKFWPECLSLAWKCIIVALVVHLRVWVFTTCVQLSLCTVGTLSYVCWSFMQDLFQFLLPLTFRNTMVGSKVWDGTLSISAHRYPHLIGTRILYVEVKDRTQGFNIPSLCARMSLWSENFPCESIYCAADMLLDPECLKTIDGSSCSFWSSLSWWHAAYVRQ